MSTEVKVKELPMCYFCGLEGRKHSPAQYDFKTRQGPWANGCTSHWVEHRAHVQLGTGMGQKLIVDPGEYAGDVQEGGWVCPDHEEEEPLEGTLSFTDGSKKPAKVCPICGKHEVSDA